MCSPLPFATVTAGRYGLYSESAGVDHHMIFANVDLIGGMTSTEAAMRPMSVHQFVLVDSRVRNDPSVGPNMGVRLHENVQDVFIANNQFELQGGGIWLATQGFTGGYSDQSNIYIRGNRAYRDTAQESWHSETQVTEREGRTVSDVTIVDNILYLPLGSGNDYWQITGDGAVNPTYRNNTGAAFTSIPAFSGG